MSDASSTSYWLAIHTGEDYGPDEYDAAAGSMVNMLTTLMADSESIKAFTRDAVLESAVADIEVSLDPEEALIPGSGRELVGKVVLDLKAADVVPLDKGAFSKLVKCAAAPQWPKMRIVKKRVPDQN